MKEEIARLAALLKSRKAEDRIRAVSGLRRFPLADTQEFLLTAMTDRSGFVACEAVKCLAAGAQDEACIKMADRFLWLMEDGPKRDPGCHQRAEIAIALAKRDWRPACDALRPGLKVEQVEAVGGVPFDTGAHLRANCALALAHLGARDIVPDIATILFDTGPERIGRRMGFPSIRADTRKAAAEALGSTGEPAASVALALKLQFPGDESPEVLRQCMEALAQLDPDRAIPLVALYLDHRDELLAASAALVLASMKTSSALDAVLAALGRFRGDLLRAVLLAISSMRTDEAVRALDELTRDQRADIRAIAKEIIEP